MPEILRVIETSDIAEVASLAAEIWRRHYLPIIGRAVEGCMLAIPRQ